MFHRSSKRRQKNIKNHRRTRRLMALLCDVCMLSAILSGIHEYYALYNRVPSVLRFTAGQKQQFNLDLPLTGQILSVGQQGVSNIPASQINIDLSGPVTLDMDTTQDYVMDVRILGVLPFKKVELQVIEETYLTPMGTPVGIYLKAEGLLVVGVGEFKGMDGLSYCPARYALRSGDYILQVNGHDVTNKQEFLDEIENGGGRDVRLQIRRGIQILEYTIKPMCNVDGVYKLGIWVRDNAQGVGTMTFVDSHGRFGALGHGISDVDTGEIIALEDGTLYQTKIVSLRRGKSGEPGEMTGMIAYEDGNILGDITYNGREGIFGTCNERLLEQAGREALPIGLKQDIHTGKAQILCTVEEEPAYYDIEITEVRLDHDNVNRGIVLTVTDPKLLELTGGIIQGMSGSPIIQDGKLIGAVTHVLVRDSTKGYGIFIETMLEH